jgi:hypothetical protein
MSQAKSFFSLLGIVYGLMLVLIPLAAAADGLPYLAVMGSLALYLLIPATISIVAFAACEFLCWRDKRKEGA